MTVLPRGDLACRSLQAGGKRWRGESLFDDIVFSNDCYQNKKLVFKEIFENPEAQGPCSFHRQPALILQRTDTMSMLG